MKAKTRHTDQNTTNEWHAIDAANQPVGRLATKIACLLLGKHRTDYATNKVSPVYVVVTNTDLVTLTGNKEQAKMYYRYTGYPGGMRSRTAQQQRLKDSRKILELAVFGMLPKNSLRALRIKHLRLFAGNEHPHQAQVAGAKKVS